VATNVQTLVIPGCGHFVPDEAPNELLAALIPFLAV
jgi:pimeloyl-ACP methyl ester carboxylesterase